MTRATAEGKTLGRMAAELSVPGAELPPYFKANLRRLHALQEAAPDITVLHEEEPWTWTVLVPSLAGEDYQKLSAAALDDLIPPLELVLGTREEARRTSIRGSLDVLRMAWGEAYWMGWDGGWWYQRRDGLGGKVTAPTPEVLGRLMAEDYGLRPVGPDQ